MSNPEGLWVETRYTFARLFPDPGQPDPTQRKSRLSDSKTGVGGGAIVHDREITYSLCVPADNRWAQQNNALYGSVHECVIKTFQDWGVQLRTYRTDQDPPVPTPNHFLCFQRRTSGDLVWQAHKIVGSAQRRNKHAILQHGSILMESSSFAPQLPGIIDLTSIEIDQHQWIQCLVDNLYKCLGFEAQIGQLSSEERGLADRISEARFDNDDWNIRRQKHPI